MTKVTGAKAIAQTLKAHNVEYVFYIFGYGVPVRELAAEGITMVLTRNEKCAAYMADGYARISQKPGVAWGYRGPGSVNLAAGLADAYWSSSPVIALTSATQKTHVHRDSYQGIPDIRHFDEVTKWNVDVPTPDIAGECLRNGFQIATSGCPGPVHINFHANAIYQEADITDPFGDKAYHKIPAKRVRPDPEDTKTVAKALVEARRPVIVAGQGALISGAWDEVIQLADLLKIPVATSNTGKGVIPDAHPLAIGVAGLYSKATANKMIQDSDLVFYIGCKTGNMATGNWTTPTPDTTVVQLDIDPEFIGRNYKTAATMVCDAKLGLQDLIATLKQLKAKPPKGYQSRLTEVADLMKQWNDEAAAAMSSDAKPITGHRLIKEIRNALTPHDILVTDTGSETIWSSLFYEVVMSGHNYICASGSLGWSFPAAIGAKLAAGDRKVLNLIGDGGIGYHIGEFETAVRYNVPVVAVVLNNMSWAQPRETLTEPVGFSKVAQAFGGFGARVEHPENIADALKEAFDSGKPAIIDVVVDRGTNGSGYAAMRASRSWIPGAPTKLPFM
ncbi:MAG: thiamine pyrophosphate-binding protein [Candidatus Bathyarchaeota archaeon]|nr:thiamine pyrophosphate-binding protein [Candidatus Bathyarchaeota archaeon]